MKCYQVRVQREGEFWLLAVPELDLLTQARYLTESEEMAQDLIATWLEVVPESFTISLDTVTDGSVSRNGCDRKDK